MTAGRARARRWGGAAAGLLVATTLLSGLFSGLTPGLVPGVPAAHGDLSTQAARYVTSGDEGALAWSVGPAARDGGHSNRAWLVYTLAKRKTITDRVLVTNTGNAPLRLSVYPADAVPSSDGQFTLAASAARPVDVGAWTTVRPRRLQLAPGGEARVTVTVRVPADAAPGDHSGGVVTASRSAIETADGPVQVESRAAVRLHVRVPGPATTELDAEALAPHWEPGDWWNPFDDAVALRFRMVNSGQTRVTARAGVEVTGPLGLPLGDDDAADGFELGPGSSRIVDAGEVPIAIPGGPLQVLLTLRGTDPVTGEPLRARLLTAELGAYPWALLTAVVAVAGAAWALLRRIRRPRRRRPDEAPVEAS